MKLRAVLFDLDGTLLDTLDDLADATNQALDELGYRVHPTDAYRRFVGDGIAMLVRRVLPPDVPDQVQDRVRDRVAAIYGQNWDVETRPYPGILELLASLGEQGVPLAILSNKPHAMTVAVVDRLLPGVPFAPVLGQRPDVPRKPDPQGAREVAAAMDLDPGAILYLGDTDTDMKTACAAGMFPVGALWGFREAAELLGAGARILVEHPREVLDLLEERGGVG